MRLIDLTRKLDPTAVDRVPEPIRPLAAVLAPKVQYLAPGVGGATGCARSSAALRTTFPTAKRAPLRRGSWRFSTRGGTSP